jgi:hypothetical protein
MCDEGRLLPRHVEMEPRIRLVEVDRRHAREVAHPREDLCVGARARPVWMRKDEIDPGVAGVHGTNSPRSMPRSGQRNRIAEIDPTLRDFVQVRHAAVDGRDMTGAVRSNSAIAYAQQAPPLMKGQAVADAVSLTVFKMAVDQQGKAALALLQSAVTGKGAQVNVTA